MYCLSNDCVSGTFCCVVRLSSQPSTLDNNQQILACCAWVALSWMFCWATLAFPKRVEMAHDMRQSSVRKAAAKNCSPSREQRCANEMHVARERTNRVAGTDVPCSTPLLDYKPLRMVSVTVILNSIVPTYYNGHCGDG